MEEIKKYALALWFIVMLASLKFIFEPVIQWQDDELMRLGLIERKINKIERLIVNKDNLITNGEGVALKLKELRLAFYSKQLAEEFKLQQQQLIEAQLAAHGLEVKSIGWKAQIKVSNALLTQFQVEYNFSGKTDKIAEYLLLLATNRPITELLSLNLFFDRHRAGDIGQVNARVRTAYYMVNEDGS